MKTHTSTILDVRSGHAARLFSSREIQEPSARRRTARGKDFSIASILVPVVLGVLFMGLSFGSPPEGLLRPFLTSLAVLSLALVPRVVNGRDHYSTDKKR